MIRDGRPEERLALEELQRRAALTWTAHRDYLLANPDVIALPLAHLTARRVRVAERDGAVAGFAVLLPDRTGVFELEGLFVDPPHTHRGIGRALVADALARLPAQAQLQVVANPHAEGFYARLGFVAFETIPTMFGPASRMRLAT